MSKQEVLSDFQIEMDRTSVIMLAEEQLKRVEKQIGDAWAKLIAKETDYLLKLTIGSFWWKKPRYTKKEAEIIAREIVMDGKLPGDFYHYDHELHYARLGLLYDGRLIKKKKFLEELISINHGSQAVKLNSKAYKDLTQ